MSVQPIIIAPGYCRCGCGEKTITGRIADQVLEGKTRTEAAAALGMRVDHIKNVVRIPPRLIRGHIPTPAKKRLGQRAETAQAHADWTRWNADRWAADGRPHPDTQLRVSEYRARAIAFDLKAFDLRVASAFTPTIITPDVASFEEQVRLISVENQRQKWALTRQGRAATREEARRERERVRDQIDYLRNLVGVGFRVDGQRDFNTVSFDGFLERDGSIDWMWFQQIADQQARLEDEHRAAQAVMDSPPLRNLVRAALASPQNLLENDKAALRQHYEMALAGKKLPTMHSWFTATRPDGTKIPQHPMPRPALPPRAVPAGGGDGGGGRKRGRGRGHHGADPHTTGQKRWDNPKQIALERALREAQRNVRTPADQRALDLSLERLADELLGESA